MDPRERADATLARARARGAFVVTPESAISPMDAASTPQIPRSLVAAVDRANDPEATMVVPMNPQGGRHARAVPAQGAPPLDESPAIAQEATTQVLSGPARRPLEVPPAPEPVQLEGLVPTVKQPPPPNRSRLSERLDG